MLNYGIAVFDKRQDYIFIIYGNSPRDILNSVKEIAKEDALIQQNDVFVKIQDCLTVSSLGDILKEFYKFSVIHRLPN